MENIQNLKFLGSPRIGKDQISLIRTEDLRKFTVLVDNKNRVVRIVEKSSGNFTIVPFERVDYIQVYGDEELEKLSASDSAGDVSTGEAAAAN